MRRLASLAGLAVLVASLPAAAIRPRLRFQAVPLGPVRRFHIRVNDKRIGLIEPAGNFWPNTAMFNVQGVLTPLSRVISRVTAGYDLNTRGQIVGMAETYSPKTGDIRHAYRWDRQHGFQDLTPDTRNASAVAISQNGWVTGNYGISDSNRAFRFSDQTGLEVLESLGQTGSYAKDINNRGDVVGESNGQPFVQYNGEPMRAIGDGNGYGYNTASAINDAGTVVGFAQSQAFVYRRRGGLQLLPPLPSTGFAGGFAYDLNNREEIVGTSGTKATYWSRATGTIDLNTVIGAPAGYTLVEATAINSHGDIAVWGDDPDRHEFGFLLVRK